ncbi:single-stranded DNA-binding protein [Deinococcus roseus]|uniref:single-stranded DNA-binding protein n=1 Tax=Deinococcus roseus TaxID=392414 RepID=UPI001E4C01FC|nr:single-stranded DNA-binding protein [Deinococcus roseus]
MHTIRLVGSLTRDPELQLSTGGRPSCELLLSGEEKVQGPAGERILPWMHGVLLTGPAARTAVEKYSKGQVLSIEGHLEQHTWKLGNGQKASVTRIRASSVERIELPDARFTTDQEGNVRLKGGVNEVVLQGKLLRTPDPRSTSAGTPLLHFPLVVMETYTDVDGLPNDTYHQFECVAWREVAKGMGQYSEGDVLRVQGRLKIDQWTDRKGEQHTATRVEASQLERIQVARQKPLQKGKKPRK